MRREEDAMRRATICLVLLQSIAACAAPMVEVRDRARNGALAFSSDPEASPVRTPCPPGYRDQFPDQDRYTVPVGERSVPLTVRVSDPHGVRRVALGFEYGQAWPADVDLRDDYHDLGGREIMGYVREFEVPRGSGPSVVEFRFALERIDSLGAGFWVAVRDDPDFLPIPISRVDYVSIRGFESACVPAAPGGDA
jgi:hypothetical protein